MEPGKGQGTVGINPALFQSMIDDLERKTRALQDANNTLRSFNYGLDLSRMQDISVIGQWAQDQLPHLKRRQGLAEVLLRSQPNNTSTMVQLPETFLSADAARQKAQELAGKIGKDGKIPDEVWEELKKYQLDPDFAEEFFRKLSPEDAARLSMHLRDGDRTAQERFPIFASMMAVASHRVKFDNAWLERFAYRTRDGGGLERVRHNIDEVLQHGTWHKDTLKLIGRRASKWGGLLAVNNQGYTARVFQGIARNPIAAAEFYSEDNHFKFIQGLSRYSRRAGTSGTPHETKKELRDAAANLVKAATIDADKVYDQMKANGVDLGAEGNLAEANAKRLMKDVHEHYSKNHSLPELQAAYADIAKHYIEDFTFSASTPLAQLLNKDNPNRDGIEVPREWWHSFLKEAMRNDAVAKPLAEAVIAAGERAEDEAVRHRGTLGGNPDPNFREPDHLGRSIADHSASAFMAAYFEVLSEQKAEGVKSREDLKKAGEGMIEVFAGAAFGGAIGALADGVKVIGKTILDTALPEDKKEPVHFEGFSWGENWVRTADRVRRENKIIPVEVDGKKYDGSISKYEEQFGVTLVENGKLKDRELMNVKELNALEAWLNDYAVQAATAPAVEDPTK